MILRDIKRYIQTHDKVTDYDIHHRFNVSLAAIHAMIERLISQGHVYQIPQSCESGRCSGCGQTDKTYYQWSDKRMSPLSITIEVS